MTKQKEEKRNYKLPVGYDMWDMLHCTAKCSTPCGRNIEPVQFESYSDLSPHCSSFNPIINDETTNSKRD